MTDGLPWGLTVMTGIFATMALIRRELGRTRMSGVPDLGAPKICLLVTAVVSFGVFALYLLFGQSWIWCQ